MSFYPGVFGVIASLLVGIIVLELNLVQDENQPAMAVPAVPDAGRPSRAAPHEDRAAAILARPLFSPSRRPAVAVAFSSLPRLTGTLISPSDRLALFAGNAEHSPYFVLGEGDQLGGWTVRAIDVGTVTVTGPNGKQELHVNFEGVPAQDVIASPLGAVLARPMRTHNRKEQRSSPS
jgi:hypothetical protein